MTSLRPLAAVVAGGLFVAACGGSSSPAPAASDAARPSILLVTLDTTRADAIGPDAAGVQTPAFNSLAARGRRFLQAYATAPETLPSHSSMLSGLYPGGHGVHENGRVLQAVQPLAAERLAATGYQTAAFVSSFSLARRFGLSRGFGVYDDELRGRAAERSARETTDRAIAFLQQAASTAPMLLWVHYFEPHAPYAPPEPFRSRYAAKPYLAEIAAMDEQLGRLVQAFEQRAPAGAAIIVAGDHGEGLGEHGEQQHGHLLYQSTMHVPLLVIGPGIASGTTETPVSTRRVFHTLLDWAGIASSDSLRQESNEVVLGEAMKPFLEYGWQPQIMAVEGRQKAILAGRVEIYDVVSDPGETRDLAKGTSLPPAVTPKLRDYPVPSIESVRPPEALGDAERQKLASLGYVAASAAPVVRKDAPRPADMTALFDTIEHASTLFVEERYAEAIPVLQKILAADPNHLDAALRLATAHSALGHDGAALDAFRRAAAIAPKSPDVRLYLALHYARGARWKEAVPMLERILQESPERLPALEALASLREREGRTADAIELLRRVFALRTPTPAEFARLGELAMSVGQTERAIDAFEQARRGQGSAFTHDLELGVLYLSDRRYMDARDALDRVPTTHREYPMALFKRAQVSVLLNEPDRAARIDLARRKANATTKPLIEREKLFQRKER